MKPRLRSWSFLFVLFLALLGRAPIPAPAGALALQSIQAPVLKWQHGGCFSSWCETGWYASPAVADLNGDGRPEVIASAYSIAVLDGPTGDLKWRLKSGHDRTEPNADNVGRTWSGIVVADLEVVINTAHSGFVAYDLPGTGNARILWGTGRGSYHRAGSAAAAPRYDHAAYLPPVLRK